MLNTLCWPQLAEILPYDEAPYTVSSPRLLENDCQQGRRNLCGQSLFSVRLDMVLAGLMAELGDDFFHSDLFPSRLTAAVDILTAAKILLQQPECRKQQGRIHLLYEEAQAVLQEWAQLYALNEGQTMLIAAEEAAELL